MKREIRDEIKCDFTPLDIMRYYVSYHTYEKDLLEAIKNDPESEDCLRLFRSYKNSYMRIGRNFKSGLDEKLLKTILNLKDNNIDVKKLSEAFNKSKWLSKDNTTAIVASSKFGWLINNETIIIDSLVSKLLKVKGNNYEEYCNKWQSIYVIAEPKIKKVIAEYFNHKEFKIMKDKWFRMRVFDQYLWTYSSKLNS